MRKAEGNVKRELKPINKKKKKKKKGTSDMVTSLKGTFRTKGARSLIGETKKGAKRNRVKR